MDDYKLAGALFGGQAYRPTGTGYTSSETYTREGVAQSDSSDGVVSILLDNFDPDDPQPITASTAVSVKDGDKVLVSISGYSSSVTSVIGGGDRMQEEINAVVTSANGKNSITYASTEPDRDGATDGDIWFVIVDGVTVSQWIWSAGGGDWSEQHLDDAVIASISAGKITAGTIEAAIEMLSAIITGGLVRTSETGNRVEIHDDDSAGYIKFLDADGVPRAVLSTRAADNIFTVSAGSNDSFAANINVSSSYNASTELLEGSITLDAGENTGESGRDSGNITINKDTVAIRSMVDGTNYTLASIVLSHALGVSKIALTGNVEVNSKPLNSLATKKVLMGTATSTGGMPNTAGSAWRWTDPQTVTFAEAFSSPPIVIANISDTSGVTASHVRGKTTTGFLWTGLEYGTADTGRNVKIDWIAIGE